MANAIEYALMAGRVYQSTRGQVNWLPDLLSLGWTEWVDKRQSLPSGFEATYFTKGSEIVISFAGTGSNVDWWANAGGFFGVTSTQLEQAADYYLQVKASAPVGATISFTGHSLGGGLAALMAIFFGETAVTFDQAPFRNSASVAVANTLLSYLSNPARGYSAQDLQGLTNFISAAANGGIPNESNVLDFSVQGEILSAASGLRIGAQSSLTHSPDNWFGSSIDLHSQALLTALLQSDQTAPAQHTFRDATLKLTDLLKMIFDDKLYKFDTKLSRENFIERLVRHQNGIAGNPVTGEAAVTADQMLTRFTADLWKLAQDGGLTMHDGNPSNPDLHELSDALIAFDMQKYYDEKQGSVGIGETLFKDVSGGGGIQFDTAAVVGEGNSIIGAKGFEQYFVNYLKQDSLFTVEERAAIQSLLPTLRDWYVQAGASGMNATDTLNRGAFMLGGTGSDALMGGTAADLLVGNAGNDLLQGRGGNDTLLGGAGNDTYVYTSGGNNADGLDTILDTSGQNSIAMDGATLAGGTQYGDDRVHRDANGHLYVQVDPNTLVIDGDIVIQNYAGGNSFGLNMTGPVAESGPVKYAGNGSDNYIGRGVFNRNPNDSNVFKSSFITSSAVYADDGNIGIEGSAIYGGHGFDSIVEGGLGSDIIFGGNANDRLYADTQVDAATAISNGNSQTGSGLKGDWLTGAGGNDTLVGSNAQDVLCGGDGSDLLIGGAGNDDIMGDTSWIAVNFDWTVYDNAGVRNFYPTYGENPATSGAADVIYAGNGDDNAWGELGNDVIFGEGGNDRLSGGEGNDVILGGTESDHLWGDAGDDYLDGGAENDTMTGNEGNDILIGGKGDDTLNGGTGQDTYVYNMGDGIDNIYDSKGENNILRFGAGVNKDNVKLHHGSLMLDLGPSTGSGQVRDAVHIQNFDKNDVFNSSSISSFQFADGSTLTTSELLARGFDLDGAANDETANVWRVAA